jgi:hypothetical protein
MLGMREGCLVSQSRGIYNTVGYVYIYINWEIGHRYISLSLSGMVSTWFEGDLRCFFLPLCSSNTP